MVSESRREPKYYLVKRLLLDRIAELAPGSPVPTERELAEVVNTSRTTVRQALTELVAEGRLVRRQGSGTYVAEPKLAWPLEMSSFTAQAASSGLKVETILVSAERIRATEDIATRLAIKVGAPVHQISRIRQVNGSPMALEQSHLSARRFPGLARALRETGSLYQVLADEFNVTAVRAVETIETAPASPREAELLATDTGAPMLILSRHSFASDGEPVEWVISCYRGDRYTFVATLGESE